MENRSLQEFLGLEGEGVAPREEEAQGRGEREEKRGLPGGDGAGCLGNRWLPEAEEADENYGNEDLLAESHRDMDVPSDVLGNRSFPAFLQTGYFTDFDT